MKCNCYNKLSRISLYITSLCNLACTYCYIDKNPCLKLIDEWLKQSFEDDNYYLDFSKEVVEDKENLKELQFWGGEPSLKLDRVHNVVDKFINYYPNLQKFAMSTNFSTPDWIDLIKSFLDLLGKYPDRQFNFDLQLSIDGPEYINDLGRGKGTTKLCLLNLQKLLKELIDLSWIPDNVRLEVHFKLTLSITTIKYLQTKESIIDYYKFFDDLSNLLMKFSTLKFYFWLAKPNFAVPSPVTKEDGERFANLCRICKEIEQENEKEPHIFKWYQDLTPYSGGSENINRNLLTAGCKTCKTGVTQVGLLPDKKLSLCVSGFTDLIQDYKKFSTENSKSCDTHTLDSQFFEYNSDTLRQICTVDELNTWRLMILKFDNPSSTFLMANQVSSIINLSTLGLIDPIFKDKANAIAASRYINTYATFCVRNNILITGSLIAPTLDMMKLLLNGAHKYIWEDWRE